MASIGPTLPPHLTKRKRTPDDDASPAPPPAKIHASNALESDSDDDDSYGPAAPKPTARPSIGPSLPSSIGPTLPATFSVEPTRPPKNDDEVALDSDDGEDIGPAAPPVTSTSKPSIGPTLPSTNTDEIALDSEDEDDVGPTPLGPSAPPAPKRIHGPALPPAPLSERPSEPADSDDDSDDDYGPALPTSTSHQERQARALKLAEAEAAAAAASAPKRDDWMLAPPSAGGYRAADPTKLKARRFNSGPRANTSGSSEISSIWTETPEEKRKRLENAVLGRDTGSGPSTTSKAPQTKANTEADAEQAARIRDFTEATRGRSLYEEHQAARARGGDQSNSNSGTKKSWVDEEEDDPSKRAFDKEKDMKIGGRIGTAQRRELLNKAADFGGRFAKGKYL